MQRNRPVIFAAVVLGLLAIGLTLWSVLGGGGGKPASVRQAAAPAPRSKQVVALREIPPRTVITRELVTEAQTTGSGPAMAMDAILGKLAADTIGAGQTITPSLLVSPLHRSSVANFAIPSGTRAVAVMIDPGQTMGNIVDVGDHVDVVIVHRLKYKTAGQEEGELRSGRTIAQNLLVLATDPALKQVPTPAPASAPGANPAAAPGQPAPPPAPTPAPPAQQPGQPIPKIRVVLAAPPAEAERIAAAQEIGNIHLTIRDPNAPDVAPVPEALEYPIPGLAAALQPNHIAAPAAPATSSRTSSRSSEVVRDRRYSEPMMPVPPANLPSPAGMAPGPPADTEVTVIRGTEKTRVIVPQH